MKEEIGRGGERERERRTVRLSCAVSSTGYWLASAGFGERERERPVLVMCMLCLFQALKVRTLDLVVPTREQRTCVGYWACPESPQ